MHYCCHCEQSSEENYSAGFCPVCAGSGRVEAGASIGDGHAFVRDTRGNTLQSVCTCGYTLSSRTTIAAMEGLHRAELKHVAEGNADDALAADPLKQFCERCDQIHRVNEHVCGSCGETLNAAGDCEECATLRQGNS